MKTAYMYCLFDYILTGFNCITRVMLAVKCQQKKRTPGVDLLQLLTHFASTRIGYWSHQMQTPSG